MLGHRTNGLDRAGILREARCPTRALGRPAGLRSLPSSSSTSRPTPSLGPTTTGLSRRSAQAAEHPHACPSSRLNLQPRLRTALPAHASPSGEAAEEEEEEARNAPGIRAGPTSSSSSNSSSSSSNSSNSSSTGSSTLPAAAPSLSRRAAALALTSAALPLFLSPPPAAAAANRTPNAAAAAAAAGDSTSSRFGAQATSPAGQAGLDEGLTAGGGGGGGEGAAQPRRERRSWPTVPLVTLAPGLRVSKVMRGCWQLSGRHAGDPGSDRTRGGDAVADLASFHRAGITGLDTADSYGAAEAVIGQYLRLHPWDSATTTVATKLSYVNEEEMAGVSRTLVEYAVRGALVRLGRQRLDMVQLQWADPKNFKKWLDVLKWLAELREAGLIGHIGLCNFSVPQLAKAVDSGVGVVSNQVQYSLIDRRPQLYMQQAAASYGVQLLAYGTLAGGLLADKYYDVPAAKVRLDTASKQKYGMVLRQAGTAAGAAGAAGGGSWTWMQEVLEATRAVGDRHGVSSSAVAVAWVLQQPQVAAAIVGARNGRHIRDMQAACALKLDDGDMLDLDAVWEGVPQPPTTDVYVWERGGAW